MAAPPHMLWLQKKKQIAVPAGRRKKKPVLGRTFFVRPSSAAAMSVQGVEPGEMQLPPSSLCRMKILHPGKQQTKSAATTEDACRGPTPANFSTEVGAHRAAECLVGLKQEEHIQEFYHIPPPLREVRVCGTVKGAEGYGQTFRIPRPT